MKIYTYYEDVNFKLQLELLELWKKSWEKYGFEPIILVRDDAKKSPLFNQYYDFIQSVHEDSVGLKLPDSNYCMAAQLEIVAFHNIQEPSYISDYDMINNGFEIGENLESLVHWRNDACSCFASGDSSGWEKYIKFLFSHKQTIIEWCKKEHESTKRQSFHDQDFLIAIKQLGLKENIYKMSRDLKIAGADYIPNTDNACKIIHLSHNNMINIINKYIEYSFYSQEELRLLFANKIINK
jgi:hypothetical protein